MSAISSKQWWLVEFTSKPSRVYLFPVKNERGLRKYTKLLVGVKHIKQARWSDIQYYLGVVLPCGYNLTDYAIGPITFQTSGGLVTIWTT